MKFYSPENYQSQCNERFSFYQKKIVQLLPHAQIEHIGSSAIPHCISKGDLDIYVAVAFDAHKQAIETIKSLGFSIKQDTLRTENLCMLESNKAEGVAIQLVVTGSEFKNFLDFKNTLINNPLLVTDYNRMKQTCEGMDQ